MPDPKPFGVSGRTLTDFSRIWIRSLNKCLASKSALRFYWVFKYFWKCFVSSCQWVFLCDRNNKMNLPDDRYSVLALLSNKNKKNKKKRVWGFVFPSLKQQWIYYLLCFKCVSTVISTTTIYKCIFSAFRRVIIYVNVFSWKCPIM